MVSKRVASADVPPERKPERGYVRQNHPFTKLPFYLPVKTVPKQTGTKMSFFKTIRFDTPLGAAEETPKRVPKITGTKMPSF